MGLLLSGRRIVVSVCVCECVCVCVVGMHVKEMKGQTEAGGKNGFVKQFYAKIRSAHIVFEPFKQAHAVKEKSCVQGA